MIPNNEVVEVLPVEDTPDDAELAIRSQKKRNLANSLLYRILVNRLPTH